MRLIDGDALVDVLTAISSIKVDTGRSEEWAVTVRAAGQAIAQMPTIEPKRGEWVPEFDGKFTGGAYWFSCSKCKRIVPEVRNGGWNYCPNCGARMENGDDSN